MDTIISLVFYIAGSYAMGKIGEKFGIGVMWQYFVPIYNMVLLCQCARVSPFWIIGVLVPFVNLGVIVYIYGTLGKQLGKNFWFAGLGTFLFGLSVFIMAFDDSRPVNTPPVLPQS